ncbi:hypothetical protein D3C87_1646940 [compost metagenome]
MGNGLDDRIELAGLNQRRLERHQRGHVLLAAGYIHGVLQVLNQVRPHIPGVAQRQGVVGRQPAQGLPILGLRQLIDGP